MALRDALKRQVNEKHTLKKRQHNLEWARGRERLSELHKKCGGKVRERLLPHILHLITNSKRIADWKRQPKNHRKMKNDDEQKQIVWQLIPLSGYWQSNDLNGKHIGQRDEWTGCAQLKMMKWAVRFSSSYFISHFKLFKHLKWLQAIGTKSANAFG